MRKRSIGIITAAVASVLLVSSIVQAATVAPTRRVIVVLSDSVGRPADVARQLTERAGGTLGHVYRSVFKGFSATIPEAASAALEADPRVAHVDTDTIATIDADSLPTGISRMAVDQKVPALASGGNGDSVNYAGLAQVAIVDTGIDDTHPDLNVVGGVNCARNAGCVAGLPGDGNGHGTHVSGTVAARDNGSGVIGVAPGADLYAVKVLDNRGSGYFSWIIAGLDYVSANNGTWGIDALNMSLGGTGGCGGTALQSAINSLVSANVAVVVAAGNSNADASGYIPASCANTVTVGALSDSDGLPGGLGGSPSCRAEGDDVRASFSNYGSVVDIAAPGVCILSTWPNGGYNTISGTSMATPHVTGAFALYRALNGGTGIPSLSQIGTVSPGSACGYTASSSKPIGPLLYLVSCSGGGGGGGTATAPGAFAKTYPSSGLVGTGRNITFQWNQSTGATGYRLEVYNSAGTFIKSFTAAGTSLTVQGFARTTYYQWQVFATNAGGETPADGGKWSFRT